MGGKRKALVTVLGVASMAALVTGCSDNTQPSAASHLDATARSFCENSLTADARKSFNALLGNRKSEELSKGSSPGLKGAAEILRTTTNRADTSSTRAVSACEARTLDGDSAELIVSFSWEIADGTPRKHTDDEKLTLFDVADGSYADDDSSSVALKCKIKVPAFKTDKLYLWSTAYSSSTDLPEAQERSARLSVVYPIMRKMAQELGCSRAKSLPVIPTVDTVSPSPGQKED